MATVKCIRVPADVADEMMDRLAALEGTVLCIRDSLLSGESSPRGATAADALSGVAKEIGRISVDVDVCTWDRQKEVSHG